VALLTGRRGALAAVLLAGCSFQPALGNGDIRCGDAGECPSGFRCVVGRCWTAALSDGGGCLPLSCAELGKDCGVISNGCGATVSCGRCRDPNTCGGGGPANVCGCTPLACPPGANCGEAPDGCGGTLSCGGACPTGQICGGGGAVNVCAPGACVPLGCAQQGKDCGKLSDGCGKTLDCGGCSNGEKCGAGGVPNVCAPDPD
jgi:hypothetical protein